MAMNPHEELANEIIKRLHDPGVYVERGPGDRPSRPEPLKEWQARAIMTYFEDVQRREVDGKVVVVARGPFREKNEDDE